MPDYTDNAASVLRRSSLREPNLIDKEADLDPVHRAFEVGFSAVVRWSLYQFHARLTAPSGIAIDRSTISILTRLNAVGPMRISALADYLGLDRSTLSRQVAAAVTSGYIDRARDPQDSRATVLAMSDLGREAFLRLQRSRNQLIADITSSMSASERALLAEALPILVRALEALPEIVAPPQDADVG